MRPMVRVLAGAALSATVLLAPATADEPTPAAPWHDGLFFPARIYVEPLVLVEEYDQEVLHEAAARVATLFDVPVVVRLPEAPRPDLPNEFGTPYRPGDRLLFPPIAAAMQYAWRRDPGFPDALAVIAVSGAPIGFPARDGRVIESATWSMRGQGVAAISLPLLLDNTSPPPPAAAADRLAKSMARMLGQALGLTEGDGVMQRPTRLADLDRIPLDWSATNRVELRVIRALCALADGRATAAAMESALHDRMSTAEDAAATAGLLAILLERRDAHANAEEMLTAALDVHANAARLHLTRARLAYRTGDWAGAADAWDHVVTLQPTALTWAGSHPVDWLLTHQGLPGREDGAAAPLWREPLDHAQVALESGRLQAAADAARDALTRELQLQAHVKRAVYAGRTAQGRERPSPLGSAAAIRAVALARLEQWEEAAEVLTLAQEHLPEDAQHHLEHVAVRISVGRGDAPTWQSADHSAWADRLRTGLEARRAGHPVETLDAWVPLLAALDTAWSPNVPVLDLADAYVERGDPTRARDILIRAGQAGLWTGDVRERLSALPAPGPTPIPTPLKGRIRQHSLRRFRPALAATPDTVWIGTTGGLLRVDREAGTTDLEHVGQGLAPGMLRAVAVDGDTLWLGTSAGLYRRTGDDPWTPIADINGFPVPAVTTLLLEDDGTLLAGTEAGLCTVSADGAVSWPAGLPRGRVAALTQRAGVVSANFTRFGPAVRRNAMWQRLAAPNPVGTRTRFGGVALDGAGRMMLTQRQGTGTAICRETPFAVYCDDLPASADVVGPVASVDGRLWLAAGHELGQWDAETGWRPAARLPRETDGPITAVVPDVVNGLWVVTPQTLFRFIEGHFEALVQFAPRHMWHDLLPDPRGGVWKVFAHAVSPPAAVPGPKTLPPGSALVDIGTVVVDASGGAWAIADQRLYRSRGAVWQAVANLPEGGSRYRLHTVVQDRVWASNDTHVWSWNVEDGWTAYAPPVDTLPDAPRVRGVAVTDDGRAWVAWADRIQVINETVEEITTFPRRTILGLTASGADVWVATAHDGVYRLGTAAGHWTRADGLPEDRITVLAASGSTVWAAAGNGGVARWDGTQWTRHHVGNLAVPLEVDAMIPTVDGSVWFQVGEAWYEHDGVG